MTHSISASRELCCAQQRGVGRARGDKARKEEERWTLHKDITSMILFSATCCSLQVGRSRGRKPDEAAPGIARDACSTMQSLIKASLLVKPHCSFNGRTRSD